MAQRIRLIHWNANEARGRAAELRAAGFAVEFKPVEAAVMLRELKESPPDAIVIDLSRLPSHGRELALALRENKATRRVPLVFAGGAAEKIERVRQSLPDATFAEWAGICNALRQAIANPAANPIVPATRRLKPRLCPRSSERTTKETGGNKADG